MQNFDWLLKVGPKQGLLYFMKHLSDEGFENLQQIYRVSQARTTDLQKGTNLTLAVPGYEDIEAHWYKQLRENNVPDYSVYDSDFYLSEAWACWVVYSRSYLRNLPMPRFLDPDGVMEDMRPVRRIADLGCGIAYSTAGLKQLFPDAEVVGTNLPDTKQTKLAKSVAKQVGFEIAYSEKELGKVDALLASEYFEHFEEPITHLIDVLEYLEPRTLLVANSFTVDSIGHFDYYLVGGERLTGKETAKIFSETMRDYGYEKIKTRFWNNRPNYWRLKK